MKKTLPNATLYMKNFITLNYKADAFEHTTKTTPPPKLRNTCSTPSSNVTQQPLSTQGVNNRAHESERGLCHNIPKFDFFCFCYALLSVK